MLKHRNYNIVNDFLVKIPKNHPYNKPSLNSIKVSISNNNVVQNSKLLIPLINLNLSFLGQYPKIIKAKKSVASFKVRKDSPVGLITTLRGKNAESFFNLLNSFFLPSVASNKSFQIERAPIRGHPVTSNGTPLFGADGRKDPIWGSRGARGAGGGHKNQKGSNTLSFGFNSTVVLSYLTPLDESLLMHLTSTSASQELLSSKTGGYIQMTHHYNLPTFYNSKPILAFSHKFFFSLFYVPLAA